MRGTRLCPREPETIRNTFSSFDVFQKGVTVFWLGEDVYIVDDTSETLQ
jgi:hypothetical protein